MEESTLSSAQQKNIEVKNHGDYYRIVVGETGVVFSFDKKNNYLELTFTGVTEKVGSNADNVVKLAIGLLSFYRWANSEQGKIIVMNAESCAGNTNRKFFDTLFRILEKGNHEDLFLTYYDGTANLNAGIRAKEFAALQPDDKLIAYLEKIENISKNTN